jgi:hypothetical protein
MNDYRKKLEDKLKHLVIYKKEVIHTNVGSNWSHVPPVNNIYNGKSNRSHLISYFCKNCNKNHVLLFSESELIDGEWYCKESIDKLKKG